MSDLEIAGLLFAFLVGLAIAAPIWGYDSRDGIESDQFSRRVAWLHDRPAGRPATARVAGVLRTVAHHLDAQTATAQEAEPRLAEAC